MQAFFHLMLALSAIVLLSCCAATWKWSKPGATQDDFRRDYAEAQYQAEVGTLGLTTASYSSPFLNSYQKMGESAAQGVARGLARIKIINMYMEMKGWEKVSIKNDTYSSNLSAQPATAPGDAPFARPVPGKPGYVFSPLNSKKIIGVNGLRVGSKAKDPQTGEVFRVPYQ